MRKANPIRTWAVVALLGVAVVATMACEGNKSSYPTQPEARNFINPETSVVSAAFSATGVAGLKTVIFTNESLGNITRVRWDFGDGKSSSAFSPTHTYKNFGTYVVVLKVSNSISTDTVSQFIAVVDVAPAPEPEPDAGTDSSG